MAEANIDSHNIKGLKSNRKNGSGLCIGIVRSRWNDTVVSALTDGCVKELLACGVLPDDIIIWEVPGSYELPLGAQKMLSGGHHGREVHGVVCIGTLIKGSTMHFEYICEAVTQGIMRLNLDFKKPVLFGVLCCLTEKQSLERAGLVEGGHNHGIDWAQGVVEMALL